MVARLGQAYDSWWQSVQPDLVNENLDGPQENPFKAAFRKQFGPDATAAPGGPPPKQPSRRREKSAAVPPVLPTLADAGREQILPWIAEYSPYALVSADDPGVKHATVPDYLIDVLTTKPVAGPKP